MSVARVVVAILLLVFAAAPVGCDDEGGAATELVQTPHISQCDGYAGSGPLALDPDTYCDAEVLHWEYTADTETLVIVNSRIELNCCGEHSMVVTVVDGVLVATEIDAGGIRCDCNCIFDFGVTVQGVAEADTPFRLTRLVTDEDPTEGETEVLYEGTLELGHGSGQIVLDERPVWGVARCGST